jgi:membrane protease YdiL (CAAX protease family)
LFATAHIPQRLDQVARGEMTLAAVAGGVVLLSVAGLVFSYFFLRTKNILLTGLIHGAVIVPLIGVGEDAFLPVVIVAVLYIEAYLFLRRRLLRRKLPQVG